MVNLDTIHASNAALKHIKPGLVAVFVGGTSGIGETTLRSFIKRTTDSKVYIIGRNAQAASKIIEEAEALNSEGKISFVEADVSLLKNVDQACKEIQAREDKINLLFLSPGIFSLKGRNETPEGIDRKLSLHYYSRMRFASNLLPQLRAASASGTTSEPRLARVVSVLGAGKEAPLLEKDLSLKDNYSLARCADHAITMTSLSFEELARANPSVSFVQTEPGVVQTSIARNEGGVVGAVLDKSWWLMKPFLRIVPLDECGERQLYAGTAGVFKAREGLVRKGVSAAMGSDGEVGDGAYLLGNQSERVGNEKVLRKLRERGVGKIVWEHTRAVFREATGEK